MLKLRTLEEMRKIRESARHNGKKTVWTNGCYDILHAGHVLYLQKARELGDMLIVGLNSDASVRMSKGPHRPIINEQERALVLSALSCINHLVLFDDESPIELIRDLQPDIYAKGGDYRIDTINQPERRVVQAYGGEIALLPGVEGMSTTAVIDRIIQAYENPK